MPFIYFEHVKSGAVLSKIMEGCGFSPANSSVKRLPQRPTQLWPENWTKFQLEILFFPVKFTVKIDQGV